MICYTGYRAFGLVGLREYFSTLSTCRRRSSLWYLFWYRLRRAAVCSDIAAITVHIARALEVSV